jgi:hypothetical protein
MSDQPSRSDGSPRADKRRERRRISIGHVMGLIAGLSIGLWLASTSNIGPGEPDRVRTLILSWAGFLLGGLSLIGPPLLLLERRRSRRKPGPPWGPGKLLWFSSGAASWLLWPPVVVQRVRDQPTGGHSGTTSEICYLYGTPLMALYVTGALIAGGWLNRRRRKRLARSWAEIFGLVLGLLWACTGLYVLELLYEGDLFH